MVSGMSAHVIAYDVNETMSNLAPLAHRFVDVGAPAHLLTSWFAGTLRDGIALSATGTPRPFAEVALGVLNGLWMAIDAVIDPSAASEHVLAGFSDLALHADIVPGVQALAAAGHRQVTISNGSADVATGLVERAGITHHFEHLLSVDEVGAWKPDGRVYDYVARTCGVPIDQVVLVAVHPWDLHGARHAGARTAFLDRTGAPWPSSFDEPDVRITQLDELVAALSAW